MVQVGKGKGGARGQQGRARQGQGGWDLMGRGILVRLWGATLASDLLQAWCNQAEVL